MHLSSWSSATDSGAHSTPVRRRFSGARSSSTARPHHRRGHERVDRQRPVRIRLVGAAGDERRAGSQHRPPLSQRDRAPPIGGLARRGGGTVHPVAQRRRRRRHWRGARRQARIAQDALLGRRAADSAAAARRRAGGGAARIAQRREPAAGAGAVTPSGNCAARLTRRQPCATGPPVAVRIDLADGRGGRALAARVALGRRLAEDVAAVRRGHTVERGTRLANGRLHARLAAAITSLCGLLPAVRNSSIDLRDALVGGGERLPAAPIGCAARWSCSRSAWRSPSEPPAP